MRHFMRLVLCVRSLVKKQDMLISKLAVICVNVSVCVSLFVSLVVGLLVVNGSTVHDP